MRTYNRGVLVYDEELFDALYNATLPDGRVIHYCRELLLMGDPPRWKQQMKVLRPLLLGDSLREKILIVGCGFSPLLERLQALGTDPSPFIQEHQATEVLGTVPAPFIQEHQATKVKARQKVYPYAVPYDIPKSWHGQFDLVITDDVLPGLESTPSPSQPRTEAHEFLDECSAMGERVIHFVTSDVDEPDHPLFTYHSLEEWSHFAPDHVWVRDQTMEVIWSR